MDVEIRLEGEGVSPQIISSRQVAKLIEHFEVALEALMIHTSPALGLKEGEFVAALQEIKAGSLRLVFQVGYEQDLPTALGQLGQALNTMTFDTLPLKVVDALAEMQSVMRRYRAALEIASFDHERKVWGRLSPEVALRTRRILTTTETLYGRVIAWGARGPHARSWYSWTALISHVRSANVTSDG